MPRDTHDAADTGLEARAEALNAAPPAGLADRLRAARDAVEGRLTLTTGFGLEGQLLTHVAAGAGLDLDFVTLDTGRLFPETHALWAETEARYGIRIRAIHPDAAELDALVAEQGPAGFRDSTERRLACCRVRKVSPLDRALAGAEGWITGLRRGQSETRRTAPFAAADPARGLLKISPLFDWSAEAVADHVRSLEIPYNALHDRGFRSIGCAPCTRAVRVGEDERAGRWWWEDSVRECGLHLPRPATARAAPERTPPCP